MPADNTIYETLDDWWDSTGSVAGIHAMNPARAGYFLAVIQEKLGLPLRGLRVLDVGCGGGILTEKLLEAGILATGVDLATGALRCALVHARSCGFEPPTFRHAVSSSPSRTEPFLPSSTRTSSSTSTTSMPSCKSARVCWHRAGFSSTTPSTEHGSPASFTSVLSRSGGSSSRRAPMTGTSSCDPPSSKQQC